MNDDVILISGIACFSLTLLGLLLTVLEFRRLREPSSPTRQSTDPYVVRQGRQQPAL